VVCAELGWEERTLVVSGSAVSVLVGKVSDVMENIVEQAVKEPVRYLVNWGRLYALWPVHVETACCSIEFGAASGPRFDLERFGILEAFGSVRQCDLLVIQGTVTRKMLPRLKWIYEQMPEPKWVMAMGACAISGGLYIDSYNVIPGIDKFIPVDVYVPGCPPRPETLIQGFIELQAKIRKSKVR
jgi:NADH-quinone oxidoreductase subunit B